MPPHEAASTCYQGKPVLARLNHYHVRSAIMSSTCILSALAILLGLFLPISAARAEIQQAAAAGYIRALFDANMMPGSDTSRICSDVAGFGRFAAGHAWQSLGQEERLRFAGKFCALASEAVDRLRRRWPGLHLVIEEANEGPQGLQIVSSLVRQSDGATWPVDWTVALDEGPAPRLADLKILGVSLGIFLRTIAQLRAGAPATADQLIGTWRRALDRALPPTLPDGDLLK
ncbi:ABC transporter substrate-binding protein [Dongia sp.]|uniref:ABC transporter substrate-binding protein n=1 Tax=Dongia sp. TaxID=1977262 RepID=UPI0035B3BDF7